MLEIIKALQPDVESVPSKYDLTIEELMEIDEYHKQGKIHPLETKYPSLNDLRKQVGRYGLQAEEYLMSNNYSKYMRLRAQLILEEELIKIDKKVEKFMDDMIASYSQPKNADYIMKVNHRIQFQNEMQERIFEEIIKPFALGD